MDRTTRHNRKGQTLCSIAHVSSSILEIMDGCAIDEKSFWCFCISSASSTLQSDINPNYGGYSTDYGRQHWSPYPGFLCPSQVEQTQTHVLSTHFLLYEAFQTRSPSQIVLNTGNVDRWNLFVHWGFEILKDHGEWLSTISTCTGDLKLFYQYKHMQVLSQQASSL